MADKLKSKFKVGDKGLTLGGKPYEVLEIRDTGIPMFPMLVRVDGYQCQYPLDGKVKHTKGDGYANFKSPHERNLGEPVVGTTTETPQTIREKTMTPKQVKSARTALGLTQRGLEQALGMTDRGGRSVRSWESEKDPRNMGGPCIKLTNIFLKHGVDILERDDV